MPLGLLDAVPRHIPSVPCRLAPPHGFRAAEGVVSVWLTGEGPFGATPKRSTGTAAQRAGKRYEKKALSHLGALVPGFRPLQWFKFWDGHRIRFCQPDGYAFNDGMLTIFEVKVSFTADAWWQLRKLYEPVLCHHFMPGRVKHLVVCKHFDPLVQFPEPFMHTRPPFPRTAEIGVYQWTA